MKVSSGAQPELTFGPAFAIKHCHRQQLGGFDIRRKEMTIAKHVDGGLGGRATPADAGGGEDALTQLCRYIGA